MYMYVERETCVCTVHTTWFQGSFWRAGKPYKRHPAPKKRPQPADSFTTEMIKERCKNSPPLEEEHYTPQQIQKLWETCLNPKRHDCLWHLQRRGQICCDGGSPSSQEDLVVWDSDFSGPATSNCQTRFSWYVQIKHVPACIRLLMCVIALPWQIHCLLALHACALSMLHGMPGYMLLGSVERC